VLKFRSRGSPEHNARVR